MPTKVTDGRSKSTRTAAAAGKPQTIRSRKGNTATTTSADLFAGDRFDGGYGDDESGVGRLYTVAMMTAVLGAPPAA
ncbi:MAG: hypothetical protein WCJ18_10320, partial [Planctomycetota bacterium]